MQPCTRLSQRAALTVATIGLTTAAAFAQGTGLPTEVLKFSFLAPPPPQVTLRAWDGHLLPDHEFNLVAGPVQIDWNRTDLDWRFLWSANTTAVTSVRWELSKYPFPAAGDFVPAPGFGLTGTSSTQLFFVDLNLLAPRPPNWTPKLAFQGLAGAFTSGGIALPPTEITPTTRITRSGALNVRFPGAIIPDDSRASAQAYAVQADPVIAQSMSLYARVVPLDADGKTSGPPSNVVILEFFEPDPTNVLPPVVFVHPWVDLVEYYPVRPYTFDWTCHVIYSRDVPYLGGVIEKGTTANICDDDSSIFEDVFGAFADFFEFAADFADWVADTYSDIKAEAASQMSGVLTDLGIPCNETCASIALSTAMAAAGMPPEIPDVEQLKAMGEGYLVDAVANYAEAQGVPVPEPVREELRKQAAKLIDNAVASVFTGGDGSEQLIPDVSYQFHGPIVVLNLTNPSSEHLSMTDTLRIHDPSGRYKDELFFIPPIRPGKTMRIALTLDPVQDPKGWMALLPTNDDDPLSIHTFEKVDAARLALNAWRALYDTEELVVEVKVIGGPSFTKTLLAK